MMATAPMTPLWKVSYARLVPPSSENKPQNAVEDLSLAACTHTIVASAESRNPVEEPHNSIHPPGSPCSLFQIEHNLLIIIAESPQN